MGRMATHIAEALMGKNKVNYDPSADCGDYVVVTNFKDVVLSGRKREQKLYRRHSMIPGGLKEVPFSRMFDERPEQVGPLWLVLFSENIDRAIDFEKGIGWNVAEEPIAPAQTGPPACLYGR